MAVNTIVTIGREFGSGGKEVGEKLAAKLGVKCYDKELLTRAAKESGICQDIIEVHDEKPTKSFLYSLVMDTYSMGYMSNPYMDMPLDQKVFLAQFDAIRKIASEGPCVMVGRCADYALSEWSDVLNVFIQAPIEDRIKRICQKQNLSEEKAKDLIVKTDKKRASYYNFYSNKKWGMSQSYDICINSSVLGIDGTVALLESMVQAKDSKLLVTVQTQA